MKKAPLWVVGQLGLFSFVLAISGCSKPAATPQDTAKSEPSQSAAPSEEAIANADQEHTPPKMPQATPAGSEGSAKPSPTLSPEQIATADQTHTPPKMPAAASDAAKPESKPADAKADSSVAKEPSALVATAAKEEEAAKPAEGKPAVEKPIDPKSLPVGNWIWAAPEKDAAAPAGKQTVYFRREFDCDQPSSGAIRIATPDHFTLWINGRKLGEGGDNRIARFNLSGVLEKGSYALTIEATGDSDPNALLAEVKIISQGGQVRFFSTSRDWEFTTTKPEGEDWQKPRFAAANWKPAAVLFDHAHSPWRDLSFATTYHDRYQLPPGFQIERIAEPEFVGSLVSMAMGNDGKLFVSQERGPILVLRDKNGDGQFDDKTVYSEDVINCQGLCQYGDDLFVVGQRIETVTDKDGKTQKKNGKVGVFKLPDANHDDKADSIETVMQHYQGGMSEHGPHTVVVGPDGFLYYVSGNQGNGGGVPVKYDPNSPVRSFREGVLLEPRLEDATGIFTGLKSPGGSIMRFSPDGKDWTLETVGFRNEYDIGINADGEVFTFDSDMEWDVGQPWYRPVRVNHAPPGAEFGWRSGAGKWPEHFYDSLPATIDIGRGSPTGVVFYEHEQFPEEYRGNFLISDWSLGRIIAVALEPNGASYTAKATDLITGSPLNVSDVEVDRDGSVVFTTGGRNTEGGVYRVRFAGSDATGTSNVPGAKLGAPVTLHSVDEALRLPQWQAAWAREAFAKLKESLGDKWQPELTAAAKDSKRPEAQRQRALMLLAMFGPQPSPELLVEMMNAKEDKLRAFATLLAGNSKDSQLEPVLAKLLEDPSSLVRRRACEAYLRDGFVPPLAPVLKMLTSSDRFERYSGRLALERIPAEQWKEQVLASDQPMIVLEGLLALDRLAQIAPPPKKEEAKEPGANTTEKVETVDKADTAAAAPNLLTPDEALAIEKKLLERTPALNPIEMTALLRAIQNSILSGAKGPDAEEIGKLLLAKYPTGDVAVDAEIGRLLARLQVPGAIDKLFAALESAKQSQVAIHDALCLAYLDNGWNEAYAQRLFKWYDSTKEWVGGHSFAGNLSNVVAKNFAKFSPEMRRQLLLGWADYPVSARLLLERSSPDQIADYGPTVLTMLDQLLAAAPSPRKEELTVMVIDKLAMALSPEAQAKLRDVYAKQPDRRGQIAHVLASQPNAENLPILVSALDLGQQGTTNAVLKGLKASKDKLETPAAYRSMILAALRSPEPQKKQFVNVLANWTAEKAPKPDDVAYFQSWYASKYPDQPAAELPKTDSAQLAYTYQQLLDFVNSPPGMAGNAKRGREIFAKANCIKCHQFLDEGQTIGPDLTAVRRRFQRKEILDSILFPSQVVSDQFRSVTVLTADGEVFTGLRAVQPDESKVVLILPDASKMEIPADDVDEIKASPKSVMPEGLLKELSLQDIADLFAFLETSKFNAEKPAAAAAGATEAGAPKAP